MSPAVHSIYSCSTDPLYRRNYPELNVPWQVLATFVTVARTVFNGDSAKRPDTMTSKPPGGSGNNVRGESTKAGLMESEMDIAKGSLRLLVEKWFAPTPVAPVRVTRLSPAGSNQMRCVRVEALRAAGSIAILFFRHDDGTWCVFPPRRRRLAMRAYSSAAQLDYPQSH